FRAVGQEERAANSFLPRSAMCCALNSRTRPAATSASPLSMSCLSAANSSSISWRLKDQSRRASRMTSLVDAYSPASTALLSVAAISAGIVTVRRSIVDIVLYLGGDSYLIILYPLWYGSGTVPLVLYGNALGNDREILGRWHHSLKSLLFTCTVACARLGMLRDTFNPLDVKPPVLGICLGILSGRAFHEPHET